jgi:putative transposase
MHVKPVRYQNQRCLHFITFSCYRRMPLLESLAAKDSFEAELERVRTWYGCYIMGYVVMPEHVHLLLSETERSKLSVVMQMLKQITSKKLRPKRLPHFWQVRYYDFPVWTEAKRIEKLRYIHRNPVKRGLVEKPEDWKWSSFVHYATGTEGIVEIESQWTARKREQMGGVVLLARAHPPAKNAGRVGHPAMKSLKQGVARRLALRGEEPFWQARYYDFNVWSERKFVEKLRYLHRNPVIATP